MCTSTAMHNHRCFANVYKTAWDHDSMVLTFVTLVDTAQIEMF
jgi:hypothetical protein